MSQQRFAHLSIIIPDTLVTTIRQAVRDSQYIFSVHANDKLVLETISPVEVEQIVLLGTPIEYDNGQGGDPSGILFNGRTTGGRPLHVKMGAHKRGTYVTWVVTVYIPEARYFEQEFSVRISTKVSAKIAQPAKTRKGRGK